MTARTRSRWAVAFLGVVLAALIVSILALIVSTAAVLYNRRQARASRELTASATLRCV